ncbi:hypothetical protein ACLOJK_020675 [Asimina triloba]
MKSFPFAAHERPARHADFSLCATFLAYLLPKLPPYVSVCASPLPDAPFYSSSIATIPAFFFKWVAAKVRRLVSWRRGDARCWSPCAGSRMDHAGMGFRWAMAGDRDLLASDEDGVRKMLFGGADLGGWIWVEGRTTMVVVEADGCSWVARWVSTHLDLGIAAGQGRIAWILAIDVGRRRLGWKELLDRVALSVGDEDGRGWISPRKTMAERSSSRSWLPVMGGALGGVGSGSVHCPHHFGRLGFSMQVVAGLPIVMEHRIRCSGGALKFVYMQCKFYNLVLK